MPMTSYDAMIAANAGRDPHEDDSLPESEPESETLEANLDPMTIYATHKFDQWFADLQAEITRRTQITKCPF